MGCGQAPVCAPSPPVPELLHHLTPPRIVAITTRQGMLNSRTRPLVLPCPLADTAAGRRSPAHLCQACRTDSALTPHQRCPAQGPAVLPARVSSPCGGRCAIRLAGCTFPRPRALRRRWWLVGLGCEIIDSLPCQCHVAAPLDLYYPSRLLHRQARVLPDLSVCAASETLVRPTASPITSSFFVPRATGTLTSSLAP